MTILCERCLHIDFIMTEKNEVLFRCVAFGENLINLSEEQKQNCEFHFPASKSLLEDSPIVKPTVRKIRA